MTLIQSIENNVQTITDFKAKYPNAFNYLIAKQPTSMSVLGWGIELHFIITGSKLTYDFDDIKYLNMLHEAVDLRHNNG